MTLSCSRGRTAPARPIASRRFRSCRRDAVCAARCWRTSPTIQGDGSWAVSAEVEGALGLATLGTGIDPPAADASSSSAALPDRPRAGGVGYRVRRSLAHGVADAHHGRTVFGAGLRAPALLRSPGACDRQRALRAGVGARPFVAFAQPLARGAQLRRSLVRCDRTRNGGTGRCGRGDAQPDRGPIGRDAARAGRDFRISVRGDRARWLDGKCVDVGNGHGSSRIVTARSCAKTVRAMLSRAARSTGRI